MAQPQELPRSLADFAKNAFAGQLPTQRKSPTPQRDSHEILNKQVLLQLLFWGECVSSS